MHNASQTFVNEVTSEFNARVVMELARRGSGIKASMEVNTSDKVAVFCIKAVDAENNYEADNTIEVPLPYVENGCEFIVSNSVVRPTSKYFIKNSGITYSYMDIVRTLFTGDINTVIDALPATLKKKYNIVQQLSYGIRAHRVGITVKGIQRIISYFVNSLQLHETIMNSWFINHKTIVVDPEFDAITDPNKVNDYQVQKTLEMFDHGLCPLGLSDIGMASKNYLTSVDLRRLTPFGIKHHNPNRNLYSTLSMRGDELPRLVTESAKRLEEEGIVRRGWNWFTAFIDVEENWEDQILLDRSLIGTGVWYTKRFILYSKPRIKVGDNIRTGTFLDDSEVFSIKCEKAKVMSMEEKEILLGNTAHTAVEVTIEYFQTIKEGTKITNTAANKGVIRFADLGYAVDPVSGAKRKIQVLAAAKAVDKRHNYTQILEAVFNNCGEGRCVVPDDAEFGDEAVREKLAKEGLNPEGEWECDTCYGKFNAVSGTVFWGVTHDAESTVWSNDVTKHGNIHGIRSKGLKFSTVEFRALETRFGKDNLIAAEILEYCQGSWVIEEKIKILRHLRGELAGSYPELSFDEVGYISSEVGTLFDRDIVNGTVVDEFFMADGFILKLPFNYKYSVSSSGELVFSGATVESAGKYWKDDEGTMHTIIDSIYVPPGTLRTCWKHPSGKFGMNNIGSAVNSIVELSNILKASPDDASIIRLIYNNLAGYISSIVSSLGGKRGDISILGMSVRYPFSVKAVATLSSTLPKNVISIHTSMAEELDVKEGDVVLVERFPCLGFMSVRPQKVHIHNDSLARYTIRVSGNSLGSESLDFDGDNLFLASFHNEDSKRLLKREFENPNKTCYSVIKELNRKMGVPKKMARTLAEYKINTFPKLTKEATAEIVGRLSGVKNGTGPVVALAYNLMRLVENSNLCNNHKTAVGVEVFLDKVANSVFKQKHGVVSLSEIVREAVCKADVKTLITHGFDEGISTKICNLIREKAREIGVTNLEEYHAQATAAGATGIIATIVRKQNRLYFASRAQLPWLDLLEVVDSASVVDIPSALFVRNMKHKAGVTQTDKYLNEKLLSKVSHLPKIQKACAKIFKCIDNMLIGEEKKAPERMLMLGKICNGGSDYVGRK